MKPNITPFFIGFSIFTVIILLFSLAIQTWVSEIVISPVWPVILVFLYAFTLIATIILVKYIGSSRISQFANAFMLVNFGKLVLFTIIIVAYAWLYRNDAISFTITFFLYYILMTTYEIVALLKLQKKS